MSGENEKDLPALLSYAGSMDCLSSETGTLVAWRSCTAGHLTGSYKKNLKDRSNDVVYQNYVKRYFTQIANQLKGLYYKDGREYHRHPVGK